MQKNYEYVRKTKFIELKVVVKPEVVLEDRVMKMIALFYHSAISMWINILLLLNKYSLYSID